MTEQGRTIPGNQSESKDSLNGGGEAVFIAVESPVRPPGTHTSSSTSSRFGVTSSTYEESEAVTGMSALTHLNHRVKHKEKIYKSDNYVYQVKWFTLGLWFVSCKYHTLNLVVFERGYNGIERIQATIAIGSVSSVCLPKEHIFAIYTKLIVVTLFSYQFNIMFSNRVLFTGAT